MSLIDLIKQAKTQYELMEVGRWIKYQSKAETFQTLVTHYENDLSKGINPAEAEIALAEAVQTTFTQLKANDPRNTHQITSWLEALNQVASLILRQISPAQASDQLEALITNFTPNVEHTKFFLDIQKFIDHADKLLLSEAQFERRKLMQKRYNELRATHLSDSTTLMQKLIQSERRRDTEKESLVQDKSHLLEDQKDIVTELAIKNGAAEASILELMEHNAELTRQYFTLQFKMISIENIAHMMDDEIIALRSKLEEKQVEHEALTNRLSDFYNGEVDSLRNLYSETQTELENVNAAYNRDIDELISRFKKLDIKVDDLRQEAQAPALENRQLAEALNLTSLELDMTKAALAYKQNELLPAAEQIDTLKTQCAQQSEHIRALSVARADDQSHLTDSRRQAEQFQEISDMQQKTIILLNGQLRDAAQNQNKASEKTNQLFKKLDKANEKNIKLKREASFFKRKTQMTAVPDEEVVENNTHQMTRRSQRNSR